MAEVMLAYDNGAEIEWKNQDYEGEWKDDDCPEWNWGVYHYRIKPKPKTRPMTIEEIAQLDSWKIQQKNRTWVGSIVCTGDDCVFTDEGSDRVVYDRDRFIEKFLQYPSGKPFEVEI